MSTDLFMLLGVGRKRACLFDTQGKPVLTACVQNATDTATFEGRVAGTSRCSQVHSVPSPIRYAPKAAADKTAGAASKCPTV